MYTKMDKIKIASIILFVAEILLIVLFKTVLQTNIAFLVYIFLALSIIQIVAFLYVYYLERKQRVILISNLIEKETSQAFEFGQVGFIIYDENNCIKYTSENLDEFNYIGEKLTKIVEDAKPLFKDNLLTVTVNYNDKVYEFNRCEDEPVILVKDVTELQCIKQTYEANKTVLGLVNFDNYAETVALEDEAKIAEINANIRQSVITWVNELGGTVRRIRSDRFFIVCTEACLKRMIEKKFDILDTIKKTSEKLNVAITASMVFASGCLDVIEADNSVNSLMELVLSRGGDQVAIRELGKEIQFYGTSSESSEKTSKVKARVIAQGLNGILGKNTKVFIVPHKDADLDSIGAALGMDNIAKSYKAKSYIVFNETSIEPKTYEIYQNYKEELSENHKFITEEEACEIANEKSLIIVVDHHSFDLCSATELVRISKNVVIIDHHRRKTEDCIPAMMIYNESSSSSTVELVSELIHYQKEELGIPELDATIMYAGLLVDTDYLKARCSSRTFEACSYIKKLGANTTLANDWLKDTVEDILNKNLVVKNMEIVDEGIIISYIDETRHNTRTALSQAADYLLNIKDIEAVFVIGKLDSETVAISARSTNKINVQLILEKLGGGGHFNAAGLQKTNISISALKQAVLTEIEEYKKEGNTDESNLTI